MFKLHGLTPTIILPTSSCSSSSSSSSSYYYYYYYYYYYCYYYYYHHYCDYDDDYYDYHELLLLMLRDLPVPPVAPLPSMTVVCIWEGPFPAQPDHPLQLWPHLRLWGMSFTWFQLYLEGSFRLQAFRLEVGVIPFRAASAAV